jgi:hypothetical protein
MMPATWGVAMEVPERASVACRKARVVLRQSTMRMEPIAMRWIYVFVSYPSTHYVIPWSEYVKTGAYAGEAPH